MTERSDKNESAIWKKKREDDIRRLTEINKEMLELLENRREHCEYYNLDSGCSACRAKNFCALRMIINKAKGENNA